MPITKENGTETVREAAERLMQRSAINFDKAGGFVVEFKDWIALRNALDRERPE